MENFIYKIDIKIKAIELEINKLHKEKEENKESWNKDQISDDYYYSTNSKIDRSLKNREKEIESLNKSLENSHLVAIKELEMKCLIENKSK